jgi:hypothetical protein
MVIVLVGHCSAVAVDCAKAAELAHVAKSSALAMTDLVNKFFIKVSIFLLNAWMHNKSRLPIHQGEA